MVGISHGSSCYPGSCTCSSPGFCDPPQVHEPASEAGFANFIDEWSHCDFCFTNFGVILEYLETSITTEKAIFQNFQHMALACIHYREGYTK